MKSSALLMFFLLLSAFSSGSPISKGDINALLMKLSNTLLAVIKADPDSCTSAVAKCVNIDYMQLYKLINDNPQVLPDLPDVGVPFQPSELELEDQTRFSSDEGAKRVFDSINENIIHWEAQLKKLTNT